MRKDGFGKRMRIRTRKRNRERGDAQVTQVLQLAVPPCGAVCGCWPRNTHECPPLMLFVRQLSVSFSTFVPLLILMRFCHNSRLEPLSELFRTPCSLLFFVVTRGMKSGVITQHHIIKEIKLTSAISFFFLDLHIIVTMIRKKKQKVE